MNYIAGLIGLTVGLFLAMGVYRWYDHINWRTVSKANFFATIPFGTTVLGLSFGDFSQGLIASVALLFCLSWWTQTLAALGSLRSDEHPPPEE